MSAWWLLLLPAAGAILFILGACKVSAASDAEGERILAEWWDGWDA